MCTGTHAFIPAEKTAKCEMLYVLNGQVVENVFYMQGAAEWTKDSISDMAQDIVDAYATSIATDQSEDVNLTLVRVTDVSVEDSFQTEKSTDQNGLIANAALPGNVTVATKFSTGLTGRSRRGRAYNIGLWETGVVGNEISPSTASDISQNWVDLMTALNAGSNSPVHVIASYCHDGAWRSDALVTPVTDYTTDVFIDSQRRRLTGRGL